MAASLFNEQEQAEREAEMQALDEALAKQVAETLASMAGNLFDAGETIQGFISKGDYTGVIRVARSTLHTLNSNTSNALAALMRLKEGEQPDEQPA